MQINKSKTGRYSGIFIALFLALYTIVKYKFFINRDEFGLPLLLIEFGLCGLIAFISYYQFDTDHSTSVLRTILTFLLIPFLMECAVEILNENMVWDILLLGNILMNYLINLLLYLIVFAISGSLRFSTRFVSIILVSFGIANMYVKEFKGSPLLPWDLGSISTAQKVAGGYTYTIGYEIIFAITLTVLVWKLASLLMINQKNKAYRITRVLTGTACAAIAGSFYCTDFFTKTVGAAPDFFNQTRGYEQRGAVAEFFVNTKYLTLEQPADYDADDVESEVSEETDDSSSTILETAEKESGSEVTSATASSNVTNPNIIVIMNESFSDLSVIGNFDTNEDYMPFIHSLKGSENCIEGNSYVSVLGTGTSNTEYEFLTGNSMAFLPYGSNAYQLYVKENQPSLVSTLEDQGYTSSAFHPYYKDNWNRENVYSDMGFDSYTGMEDMSSYTLLRNFVSDECDFQDIESMYENRDTSKPFFLFNVTMQNHSSYDKTYPNFDQEITLKNMDGDYPMAEQYLSLCKKTDEAFENLIDYFKTQSQPTIILMYGDHQPFIENEFYEEVMGKRLNDLTDEEQQQRYISRFILWANYDIPEGWIDKISVNYLSTLLTETAGLKETTYNKFLDTMYEKMPVITAMGCQDWDGNWFSADDTGSPLYTDLSVYERAAYNNLMESTDRADKLFYIKKKET
jgi:phosphoglycerol transferase MdoB-like AlkP superfamily enzyme